MDSFLTVSKKEERGTPNHRLQNRSVILTGCENHYVIFECLWGLRSGCLTPCAQAGWVSRMVTQWVGLSAS